MNHLVIVPCHGIWKGPKNGTKSGENQLEWYLAPFQLEGNDHLCFKQHLLDAVGLVDNHTAIVISGGKTKKELDKSEAQSYYDLLQEISQKSLESILLEEYARDSFENVIFLLARFHQQYHQFPKYITIIGFEFKRKRFLTNHLHQALGWDLNTVKYIGNAPTPETNDRQYFQELEQSEYDFAVKYFEQDWYGCKDPLLKKKVSRNPFNQNHNYGQTNPQLFEFFEAVHNQLENETIKRKLPW